MRTRDVWTLVLGIFALGNLANGLWMLFAPAAWFTGIPAAVPDFGPLNVHFVRDVGAAYVTVAVALGVAALDARARPLGTGVAAVFYVLHAAGHVVDTAGGHVGPEHWVLDLLPIYLPAVALVALTAGFARANASSG